MVCEDTDPFLADRLRSFGEMTDVALLINTSFNQRGEPIVESPHDAIRAFLTMGLDGLFIEAKKAADSRIVKWRSLGESNPCFSLERAAS